MLVGEYLICSFFGFAKVTDSRLREKKRGREKGVLDERMSGGGDEVWEKWNKRK